MDMNMKTYKLDRKKLIQLIKSEGTKQTLLAHQLGVSEKTISRWVTGKILFIKEENMRGLCHVLSCKPEDLLMVEERTLVHRLLEDNLLEKLSPHGDYDLVEKIFLNAFDQPVDDLTRAGVYLVLCNTKWRQNDFDSAFEYAHKALDIGLLNDDTGILFEVYYHLGTIKSIQGDMSSLDDLHKAYQLKEGAKEPSHIGKLCNNLGMMYREMGLLEKALDYLNEAYDYFLIEDKAFNLCICCEAFMVIYNELTLANKSMYYGKIARANAIKAHYQHGLDNILLYELDALSQLNGDISKKHEVIIEKVMKKEHVDYYALEGLIAYFSRVKDNRIKLLKDIYFLESPKFIQAIFFTYLDQDKANEIFESLGYTNRVIKY